MSKRVNNKKGSTQKHNSYQHPTKQRVGSKGQMYYPKRLHPRVAEQGNKLLRAAKRGKLGITGGKTNGLIARYFREKTRLLQEAA